MNHSFIKSIPSLFFSNGFYKYISKLILNMVSYKLIFNFYMFSLKCNVGFLERLIVAFFFFIKIDKNVTLMDVVVLSSCFLIHNNWEHQLVAEIYSTSVVDNAIGHCFLHIQVTKLPLMKWRLPLMLFLSSLSPT